MQFKKEEKAVWLKNFRRSGKSAWAYARANGLNPQTFAKWVKLENENKNIFVEIPAKVVPPIQASHGIIIEKADIKIHIPLILSSVELSAVMEGLKAVL